MNWLKGSFDTHGRVYISKKIRQLIGLSGEIEYTIDIEKRQIIIRRCNNGNKETDI